MGCGKSKQKQQKEETKPNEEPELSGDYEKKLEDVYIVAEEMGRGGFSIVKKGRHKKTNEPCAVKFIEKRLLNKQDLVLLEREIDIMKRVDHPNVLKLKEVFDTEEQLAMVMELVAGGELFYKIVERGNYSEKDAALIVKQAIEGVAYLHSEGIAHRDLKPENLLCSEGAEGDFKPFRVVIADFGLSKSFENGEDLKTSCGTPEYVAPEVITAEGSYDKAVDMWSMGVITYVLLCGFSPFASSDTTGLFDKIIRAEYDFPDPEWTSISSQAKDFIRHLLVKDPEERWTAEQCKSHPWLKGSYGTDAPLAGGDIARRITQYHLKRKEELKK